MWRGNSRVLQLPHAVWVFRLNHGHWLPRYDCVMHCLYRDDEIIYAAMSVTERFEGIQNNINSFVSLNNYSFFGSI